MILRIGYGHGVDQVQELEFNNGIPVRFEDLRLEVRQANGTLFVRAHDGAIVFRMTASNSAAIHTESLLEFGAATNDIPPRPGAAE